MLSILEPVVHGLTPGSNALRVSVEINKALIERGHTDESIGQMSGREIFSEYCTWHGLINWSDTLWDVVLVLRAMDVIQDIDARVNHAFADLTAKQANAG
ncbi:MAG: hypothetical protein PHD37_06480 [Gallionellaceae bacterium]|nr:hypothetical protein [Gallionellaceae bacterium]